MVLDYMGTTETIVPGKLSESDAVAASPSVRTRVSAFARRLMREPLVHFLLLGTLLFLYSWWKGGAGPGSYRIVITSGDVEHFSSGFIRMWQRSPTQAELKGLIDDYVKEEIAMREAMAMGLDRNDSIIRRRLRQKVEFLADDTVSGSPPTDFELQAWLVSHPGAFAGESQVAFSQVYVNPGVHGQAAQALATQLLSALRKAGPGVALNKMGDASLLPAEQPLAPLSETSRVFGDVFANRIVKLEPGQWSGPIESAFGLHLVLLRQEIAPVAPKLNEIRPQVEREVLEERRKAQLDALYQDLLKKYSVTIDWPKSAPASPGTRDAGTRP